MGKISFKKVLVAGVLFAIIAQIIHTLFAFGAMGFYTDQKYFSVWSKLMMPTAGPPPASFMAYSLAFGIIGGILIALGYSVLKKGVPGKTRAMKGLVYGLLVFLVGALPGYLAIILLINLPLMLVFLWAIESLIIDLFGGMIIAWINK